jgi:hypothetical protein
VTQITECKPRRDIFSNTQLRGHRLIARATAAPDAIAVGPAPVATAAHAHMPLLTMLPSPLLLLPTLLPMQLPWLLATARAERATCQACKRCKLGARDEVRMCSNLLNSLRLDRITPLRLRPTRREIFCLRRQLNNCGTRADTPPNRHVLKGCKLSSGFGRGKMGRPACISCGFPCAQSQTHRPTDPQTHRPIDPQTHRPTDQQAHRHTDTQTHRQTDGQTDGHIQKTCNNKT